MKRRLVDKMVDALSCWPTSELWKQGQKGICVHASPSPAPLNYAGAFTTPATLTFPFCQLKSFSQFKLCWTRRSRIQRMEVLDCKVQKSFKSRLHKISVQLIYKAKRKCVNYMEKIYSADQNPSIWTACVNKIILRNEHKTWYDLITVKGGCIVFL